MRISEVSRRTGISSTALRYYESIGLITARRSTNGYRDYDEAVLARLDLIEASKELDLPLDDIATHLHALEIRSCTEVRDRLQPVLVDRIRQIDRKLERLAQLRQRLAIAESRVADCPDRDDHCSSECVLVRRRPNSTDRALAPDRRDDDTRPPSCVSIRPPADRRN